MINREQIAAINRILHIKYEPGTIGYEHWKDCQLVHETVTLMAAGKTEQQIIEIFNTPEK